MNSNCAQCQLKFEREHGFFLGSIYFNYGCAAVLSVAAYGGLLLGTRISPAIVLAVCLSFTLVFPLWFFRYARSAFLTIDYYIHPEPRSHLEPESSTKSTATEVNTTVVSEDNAREFRQLANDDATAGVVIGVVITLAVLFGLALAVFALIAIQSDFFAD